MKTSATFVVLLAALILCAWLVASDSPPRVDPPRFAGLGDLPGGMFFSVAKGVSADALVVAGYSHSSGGMEAFCWTSGEGMQGLGFEHAAGVSADGSTVVGYQLVDGATAPVRWTADGGLQSLDTEGRYRVGAAGAVSANGSIVVGSVTVDSSNGEQRDEAFQWTTSGAIKHVSGLDGTVLQSQVSAVSADGQVVVGTLRSRNGHDEAFRWTAESGPIRLGTLPGHSASVAYGVSADGTTVVGSSSDYTTVEAFRWTAETGMVALGALRGGRRHSSAYGVSADGSVVVGYGTGDNGWEAFVWDETHGMRSIRRLLVEELQLGKLLRGWQLRVATAVSADGAVIVGFGRNPQGNHESWIARVADREAAAISKTDETHQTRAAGWERPVAREGQQSERRRHSMVRMAAKHTAADGSGT